MSDTHVEGVRLSNPDKVLYPEQGITKGDLAAHYIAVSNLMLPHVAFRPITMVRCPAGREKNCFYQRHAGSGVPEQVEQILIPGFDDPYLFIRDVAGLIALVQMGVLEIHPWSVSKSSPDRPDRLIFDLDPAEGLGFAEVVKTALEVRDRLNSLGLVSFVKTTGGKGLHVVVPIRPGHDWPEAKAWTKAFSQRMAEDSPDLYLTKISKSERTGRIFIDYLRNDPTSTAVGPYSTRARPGAPVATPLEWSEVVPSLEPASFNIRTIPGRVSEMRSDPWVEMLRLGQALPPIPG